jgi:hypothetical protein
MLHLLSLCCADPNVEAGLRTKESRANWELAFQQHYLQPVVNVSNVSVGYYNVNWFVDILQ